MINNYVSVWDRLEKHPQFMEAFNKYNKSCGNAFSRLKQQDHDIQGREYELGRLVRTMERNDTPVGALIGPAGVGKSALVEEFTKQITLGQLQTVRGREYFVVSLRIGSLKSLGNDRLHAVLANMLDDLAIIERNAQRALNNNKIKIILFIDEFHMLVTIFGPGTKIGGDVMKDVLARPPIRVIAATTRKEFDSTIAVDDPFKQRFKETEINELATPVVLQVCKNWWMSKVPKLPMPKDNIIMKIINANKAFRSEQAEPRKSLDIMEDLVAEMRITRKIPTEKTVDKIFKERFNIRLTFDFDANAIFSKVKERVIGQTMAMYELQRALRSVAFQLNKNPNRPILTLLLTGSTGVGKSETVKAICEAMYGSTSKLQNFNMPDYKLDEMEPSFRKKLGETVRHEPDSVILLDEYEKSAPAVQDAMLAILDEGIVNFTVENREGLKEVQSVSLRNTIIIATTNAGDKIFQNMAEFAQDNDGFSLSNVAKSQYEQLKDSLMTALKAVGFKPEMLGRFDRIIPYRNLTENVKIIISDKIINKYFDDLLEQKNIKIEMNPKAPFTINGKKEYVNELSAFLTKIRTKSNDSTNGGARELMRAFKSDIEDPLIETLLDNPTKNHFKVSVSRDSKLYDIGASPTKGGIIIDVLD